MAARDLAIGQLVDAGTKLAAHAVRHRGSGRHPEQLPPAPAEDQALRDAEAVLEKRRKERQREGDPEPPAVPKNLFDDVEDHEPVKALLRRALESDRPVHILLVGPAGSGKTQLLQAVATLPRSRYAVGGATSSSGLVAYLLEQPRTRILVIDELDKADQSDLYALYSLMESGRVTRLQHKAHEDEARTVWVFAAANDDSALPAPLASRFVRVPLAEYTQEQAARISERVLIKREGLPKARAHEIAVATAARSRDPRDAVQLARLAGKRGPIEPLLEQVVPSKPRPASVS
jgi:MoxR-like ATPase